MHNEISSSVPTFYIGLINLTFHHRLLQICRKCSK